MHSSATSSRSPLEGEHARPSRCATGNLSSPSRSAAILHPPHPLRGASRGVAMGGCGAAPAGLVATRHFRAAAELPPGPLGVPASSWLRLALCALALLERVGRLASTRPEREPGKAGPAAGNAGLARREAPACRKARAIRFASFGAPSPHAPDASASRQGARMSSVERMQLAPALPWGESTRAIFSALTLRYLSAMARGEGEAACRVQELLPLTLPAMRLASVAQDRGGKPSPSRGEGKGGMTSCEVDVKPHPPYTNASNNL